MDIDDLYHVPFIRLGVPLRPFLETDINITISVTTCSLNPFRSKLFTIEMIMYQKKRINPLESGVSALPSVLLYFLVVF